MNESILIVLLFAGGLMFVAVLALIRKRQQMTPETALPRHKTARNTEALAYASDATGRTQRLLSSYAVGSRGHVFLGARTGHGKTQACLTFVPHDVNAGADVLWASPHATLYHPEDQRIDLRPLARHFVMAYDYDVIADALEAAVAEIDRRLPLYRRGEHTGRAISLIIDEWPALVDHDGYKDRYTRAVKRIAREGRKCGVFLVLASQDALVDTLKLSSGLRSSFATSLAGNCDATTWRAAVGADLPYAPRSAGVWAAYDADVTIDRPTAAMIAEVARKPVQDSIFAQFRKTEPQNVQSVAHPQSDVYPIATGQNANHDQIAGLRATIAPEIAGEDQSVPPNVAQALAGIDFAYAAGLAESLGMVKTLERFGIKASGTSAVYAEARQRLQQAMTQHSMKRA